MTGLKGEWMLSTIFKSKMFCDLSIINNQKKTSYLLDEILLLAGLLKAKIVLFRIQA